jgi:translation initiation factor IF-3
LVFSALFSRRPCIDKRFIRTNERIRAREVRVIDDEGKQIGILQPFEALRLAREKNLDLVEVSPTAQPPVCRIMDFGKYLYEQDKKERAAKKHQKVITVKEVKFKINVDEHDYEFKKNHVIRFLEDGDKVKATIFFRGREMTHTNLGRQILDRLIKDIGDKGIVEFRPRMEGNTLHAILAPKKA